MRFLGIFISLAILAGCSSGSSSRPAPEPEDTSVVIFEIAHASQDAPPVNLIVNGEEAVSGADFGAAAFLTTNAGEITVEVEAIVPGGNLIPITATDDFTDGQRVTVFAANDVANIGPILLVDEQPEIPADQVRLRVVHAASNVTPVAEMVDVYISGPTDPLPAEPAFTFMFGDDVELPDFVPEGDYRVRVTPAGAEVVVYDSGSIPLAGGSDLVVAAIPNVGPGAAPIKLLVLTGSETILTLPSTGDVPTPADLRVGHIAADVVPVDIIANDDLVNRPVEGLEYGQITPGYLELPAGPINFKVVGAGTDGPAAIDTLDTVSLEAGVTYSVFAVGLASADPASPEALAPKIYVDNPRRISTEGRARIIHGSPSAGVVDIYVVEMGTDITDLDPDFPNVEFLGETDYISMEVGTSYDVIVTAPGDKTPAIPVATITAEAGGLYTAIAADAAGGGVPIGLILADDLAI